MSALKEVLADKNYSLRTQISLSPTLRRVIEAKRKIYGETLAEYIRKATILRIFAEAQEKEERQKLAEATIGSIPKDKYPEWSTTKKVIAWQKKLRRESEGSVRKAGRLEKKV